MEDISKPYPNQHSLPLTERVGVVNYLIYLWMKGEYLYRSIPLVSTTPGCTTILVSKADTKKRWYVL